MQMDRFDKMAKSHTDNRSIFLRFSLSAAAWQWIGSSFISAQRKSRCCPVWVMCTRAQLLSRVTYAWNYIAIWPFFIRLSLIVACRLRLAESIWWNGISLLVSHYILVRKSTVQSSFYDNVNEIKLTKIFWAQNVWEWNWLAVIWNRILAKWGFCLQTIDKPSIGLCEWNWEKNAIRTSM